MRKFLQITVLLFLSIHTYSQEKAGYEISVTISDISDSTIFLAYHYGDRQYLSDTLKLDGKGQGIFKGKEKLPEGIYMIVLPGRKYFEFLMTDNQHFSLSCLYNDFFRTLKFSGSPLNTAFTDYQRQWSQMQQKASGIANRLQQNKANSDSLRILSGKQREYESEMKAYLRTVAGKNSSNFLGVLVKSMIPLEIPEFSIPAGTNNPDSVRWYLRYNYNKDHFFDNIDLTDERLLRTPILQARLEVFFKNVIIQSPDSINKEIDRIFPKTGNNPKMFQFLSVFLFNHFRQSEIMGHDAVLVKLADDIYLSGKADWITEEFRNDLHRQVELLRHNLLGMTAQNLVMDSYKGIFVALHDIEKEFTVLYFWEPNCGHCNEATPKLKAWYEKAKNDGVEIFSVCTTSNRQEWADYIEKHGLTWINGWDPNRQTHFDYYYNVQATPLIYILDKNKKIIAKKLSVDDIPSFIDNYRKYFR
ncbi:MAG TPA: thioredoxin-like domain-containing protein [Bacteroidales bacterium]|jgi:thiol-disulfide isomerase/thioredoxin|nr:thioredoxin-like domain-containing protein [Bacteroidales bacterium]HOS71502.1 thioredoxin-like domain-containing protein [Bacteroidales bacterium]HQH23378.1 thioredoxin-like domain-containing protein [Bacteroidales bacterium]HQJ81377.1 thioredoxin-like domain-containing protein [Bacteroidales bacterium]